MTETQYRLDVSYPITIDANGQATVLGKGPSMQGERWVITNTSVNTTQPCIFQSFRGAFPVDSQQIDFTRRGFGASSDTRIELQTGETVSFQWSEGVVGATGHVHLEGNRFVRGRRAY